MATIQLTDQDFEEKVLKNKLPVMVDLFRCMRPINGVTRVDG